MLWQFVVEDGFNVILVFRANVFDDNEEDEDDIANCDGRYDLEFIEEIYGLKKLVNIISKLISKIVNILGHF